MEKQFLNQISLIGKMRQKGLLQVLKMELARFWSLQGDGASLLWLKKLQILTQFQINFLNAIADGVEAKFSKTDILSKYNLGTASNIKRLKESLENKELIDIDENKVTFNDPVFKLWFKRNN